MSTDPIRGKTLRFRFTDGGMGGRSALHTFGADGFVSWKIEGAEAHSPTTHRYTVEQINDDVWAVSYLGTRGYTLTTILDVRTGKLVAFASNEKELTLQHGTFEHIEPNAEQYAEQAPPPLH